MSLSLCRVIVLRQNITSLTLRRIRVAHKLEHVRESLTELGDSLTVSLEGQFASLQVFREGLSDELIAWPVLLVGMRSVFFAAASLLELLLEHLALFDLAE